MSTEGPISHLRTDSCSSGYAWKMSGKERSQQEQAVKRMAQTGLDAILQSILDGKFNPECPEVTVLTSSLIE